MSKFSDNLWAALSMAPMATVGLANTPVPETTVPEPPLYSQVQEQNPNYCSLEKQPELDESSSLREKVNDEIGLDDIKSAKDNSDKIEENTENPARNQTAISGPPNSDSDNLEPQNSNSELADQLRQNSWTTSPNVDPAYEVRTTDYSPDSNSALAAQLSDSGSFGDGNYGERGYDAGEDTSDTGGNA